MCDVFMECYGLNVCVPPKAHIEAPPTPNVMVSGRGVFQRYLGLDEATRRVPMMGLVQEKEPRDLSVPCKDPKRRPSVG